uniref:Thiazole synthase n=1 Tax=Palmaria palmata TaxID=2822 RepID=A0A1C9CH67_PALPL|nr:thiamin biosynthesis protein G [Palmaria palmata]AOM67740.1 thiamin biosynthesis protein G [Palmaria palmata]
MSSQTSNIQCDTSTNITNTFNLANMSFSSRLMLGTGKYNNLLEAKRSIEASKTSLVTVAVRRLQGVKKNHQDTLLNILNWESLSLLPNTAGCTTVEEAIRIAAMGREICKKIGQTENTLVKLEVIPDPQYLLPDPIGTLKAAEYLVNKKFTVLPYINSDPILAKQLEEIGCATVMPLGSPIGSGCGLQNIENLKIILENAKIPVIIDAGIGTASDAAKAMELGATAILVNSAIAQAKSPILMAASMKLAVEAGRCSYLSGRMEMSKYAQASSPLIGISV